MTGALGLAEATLGDKVSLVDRVYPHPRFGKAEAKADDTALQATEVAQPAIGVVSLGAVDVLRGFGVEADALAGHSYGELTALCVSGRLERADFLRLSRLRGELMASGGGDKGTMLAVRAPLADIEKVVAEEGQGQALFPPNPSNRYAGVFFVQACSQLGIALGEVLLELLNRSELHTGDCLLILVQQIGDFQITLPREEHEFDHLQVVERITIAQFTNELP